MSDEKKAWSSIQYAAECQTETIGVESGKAFVQNDELGTLQQSPCDVKPTFLPVG
jgi:hypothetical protein